MKIETYYMCPVCTKEYWTQSEAIECRNSHPVVKKQIYYCEACGQGWNPDAIWGPKGAADRAGKCEQEHRDKGEFEEVSTRTFFLSGGRHGKYYGP